MRQTGVMMGFMMQNTRPSRMVMVCCGICTTDIGLLSPLQHVQIAPSTALQPFSISAMIS